MQEFHFNKQTENYYECCQPLEQVSQGYSILGDIQILTGYSPGQFALADPALSNAWVGLDDLRRSFPTSTVLWLYEPYEVVLNAEIWSELFRPYLVTKWWLFFSFFLNCSVNLVTWACGCLSSTLIGAQHCIPNFSFVFIAQLSSCNVWPQISERCYVFCYPRRTHL